MKYNKLIEVLFKTKNINKILTEYNKLPPYDKQIILTNNKIKERLYKIADINLLVNLLIDLPTESRINFLKGINIEKYTQDYEKIIIEFMKLQDYDKFDCRNLIIFENIKDKQILSTIFRKMSSNKLKFIINSNYNQFINNFAFIEYSKKNIDLVLDAKLINNINDNILINELKRRNTNDKLKTSIDIDNFLNIDLNKQNYILINGNFENLENKLIQIYQEDFANQTNDNLIRIFKDLIQDLNYINLLKIQTIIFNIDEKSANELMKLFFKDICKIEDEIEEKYLKSMIYNFKKLNKSTKELYNIIKLKPFSIIYYINTGIIDENIDKIFNKQITITQYQKTNIKKINKIFKILNLINKNKLEKNNLTILAYKLYYIFGYENTIDLLSNKFGIININFINKLLNRCDIKNVELKKTNNTYEPIIKPNFVQFIISEKKNNNTTIKRMIRGELDLIIDEFPNLYNNFDRFQHTIGKKIHLNKLIPLLKENPFMLLPNEYKLTKEIINNIIKSYGYSDILNNNDTTSVDNNECIKEACNFYHNYLEKRTTSSIPRVIGTTKDNYQYEVLKLDDPIILTLGYQTGCCFRLTGASRGFLEYCSESLYARVIVIKNDKDEICSIIPIIRNGNVIAGNSIESNSKANGGKVYNALKCAYDDILKISNQYEEKPIIACCVTDLHSNVSPYNKQSIKKNIFPINEYPFYTNYSETTYIISSLENKTENNFELYTPNAIYLDERPDILLYHWNMQDIETKNEIEKRIKSITYQLNISEEYLYFSKYIICNEDWYLKVDYDGIKGHFLPKDIRAIEEFNTIKSYLEEKFDDKKLHEINLQESNIKNGFDHIKSKKLVLKNNNKIDK